MRIPKVVLSKLCASVLIIVGISHIPEISSETDEGIQVLLIEQVSNEK
jgi:hypothetical protein